MQPYHSIQVSSLLRFGEAVWDPVGRRLEVRGQMVTLPWRVAECLAVLLEADGAIVTREELEGRIWGGAIVEESNLTKCIASLRKALDPLPKGGSYVETVARSGYRLTVTVSRAAEEASAGERGAVEAQGRRWPGRRLAAMMAVLLLGAGVAGWGVVWYWRLRRAEAVTWEGLKLLRRGNLADAARAVPLFHQALETVPDYAMAYAGLAEHSARYGKSTFGTAIELSRKAVAVDPGCGECKAIAGFVTMTREWKWGEAGRLLEDSVRMDPDQPQRRIWYAMLLAATGRLPEALGQAETAARLNPALAQAHAVLGMIQYFLQHYGEAIRECEQTIALDPSQMSGYYWLARTYMVTGKDVSFIVNRAEEVGVWLNFSLQKRMELSKEYERIYGEAGRAGLAKFWISEVDEGTPRDVQRYNRASWFMWMGERERALEELEAAVSVRPFNVMYVAVDPAFEGLRAQPRFTRVLQGLGLRPQ